MPALSLRENLHECWGDLRQIQYVMRLLFVECALDKAATPLCSESIDSWAQVENSRFEDQALARELVQQAGGRRK